MHRISAFEPAHGPTVWLSLMMDAELARSSTSGDKWVMVESVGESFQSNAASLKSAAAIKNVEDRPDIVSMAGYERVSPSAMD
jgi:hypothetical protein